jgi:hypothetical protein
MARCLDALRKPEEASDAFEKALRERPEDVATLRFAAEFFERADNAAEAQKLYEQMLDPTLVVPTDMLAMARRRLAVLLADTLAAGPSTCSMPTRKPRPSMNLTSALGSMCKALTRRLLDRTRSRSFKGPSIDPRRPPTSVSFMPRCSTRQIYRGRPVISSRKR